MKLRRSTGPSKLISDEGDGGVMIFPLFELLTQMTECFVGSFDGEEVDQPCGRGCAGVESQFIADLYPLTGQRCYDPAFNGEGYADEPLFFRDIIRDLIGVDIERTGGGVLRQIQVD